MMTICYLIHPDSPLLEPFFQIAHFGVEDFIIIIFFKPADMCGEFGLGLDDFAELLLEVLADGSEPVEVEMEVQDVGQKPCYGTDSFRVMALHVSGNLGDKRCRTEALLTCGGGELGDDACGPFIVAESYAVAGHCFFELFVRNRAGESRLAGMWHEAGDTADEINHLDAGLSAQIKDAIDIIGPVQVWLFAEKKNEVIFLVAEEYIFRGFAGHYQAVFYSSVWSKHGGKFH